MPLKLNLIPYFIINYVALESLFKFVSLCNNGE